jgi:hypothetical protein
VILLWPAAGGTTVSAGIREFFSGRSSGISDFNFIFAQNRTASALGCQSHVTVAMVGWQSQLV